ncbi:MAG: sensor histidine kinase [Acidobacteria bacterium]|nr:sensor histidine kinase [Acidobacteriota bacterium]
MSSRGAHKSRAEETAVVGEHSRQLLKAQEEERRRISRELHDETGQALMVLRFHLETLEGGSRSTEQKARIHESLDLLDRTIEGLRRTIARLSPRVLEELGLVAAIRRQVALLSKHREIKAQLDLPDDLRWLDHDLQVAIYRSVQEALHNAAKHSRAASFKVRLLSVGGKLVLEMEDDGIGFSPRAAQQRGFGLTGMRERALALGGSMKIRSEAGKGTRIRITFPITPRSRRSGRGPLAHMPAA